MNSDQLTTPDKNNTHTSAQGSASLKKTKPRTGTRENFIDLTDAKRVKCRHCTNFTCVLQVMRNHMRDNHPDLFLPTTKEKQLCYNDRGKL